MGKIKIPPVNGGIFIYKEEVINMLQIGCNRFFTILV